MWIQNAEQLQPRNDRIFIKHSESPVETPAGVQIPESSKNLWEIVAVGPDVADLKKGDHVMLSRQAITVAHLTTPITIGGETYLIAKQEHVACVVHLAGAIELAS